MLNSINWTVENFTLKSESDLACAVSQGWTVLFLLSYTKAFGSVLAYLKLGLERWIKIVFLDFFFRIGPTCLIMINLMVVIFGYVGILMCWRLIFWIVRNRLFMSVSLWWDQTFHSILPLSIEIPVRLNKRLCGVILFTIVLGRLLCGFCWEILMLFDLSMRRTGGTTSWSGWQNDLNNCVIQACLEDLRFTGSRCIWTNWQCNNTILKKLDQVLINVKWNCDFTGLETCFLTFGISGHSPILVKMASLLETKIPFKFFDCWADHPLFSL
jgi:hypothetical protein